MEESGISRIVQPCLQCSSCEMCRDAPGRVTMRDDFRGKPAGRSGNKCPSRSATDKAATWTRDGQTSWTYDRASNGLGRLYMVKEQMSGFSRTHTYDGHGRVFQRFDASRTAADYTDFGVRHFYNARGHLARVGDARVRNGASKTTYVAVEQTDAAGRVIVSGASAPPAHKFEAGVKAQGSNRSISEAGCPLAMASSVALR